MQAALARMRALHEQGHYQQSLDISLQIAHDHPDAADAWNGAAANCLFLARWQDVIGYAKKGLALRDNLFGYDALAHAYGYLGQEKQARRYGLKTLEMRACHFNASPPILPPALPPMPPPPSAQTRQRNVIAFSLFGRDAKYCETAVLNVQDQPEVYPDWVCRFYVDGSVPARVIQRIREHGGQVVLVEGAAAQWPGPMWRLLTLDDPRAHRILFRDADSVISRREAAAVAQWVGSAKRFHMMRDWHTHTELMLAGLWGAVAGSLPPLKQLMRRFMHAPLTSRHFADQFFLRQYIWPYARASLMQHDSVFGFMDAAPFPDVQMPAGHHVGCAESVTCTAQSHQPDGAEHAWALYRIEKGADGQTREKLVCSYASVVQGGLVKVHIPARYARWMQQGTAQMRSITGNNSAA
jgi:hypothetical protein